MIGQRLATMFALPWATLSLGEVEGGARRETMMAKSAKASGKVIKLEQIGSPIRRHHGQRETLIGLGLNRIGRVKELPDTPATRGMIAKVSHLVKVVEDGAKS